MQSANLVCLIILLHNIDAKVSGVATGYIRSVLPGHTLACRVVSTKSWSQYAPYNTTYITPLIMLTPSISPHLSFSFFSGLNKLNLTFEPFVCVNSLCCKPELHFKHLRLNSSSVKAVNFVTMLTLLSHFKA